MGDYDMSISVARGEPDEVIDRIIEALRAYEADRQLTGSGERR